MMSLLLGFRILGSFLVSLALVYIGFALKAIKEFSKDKLLAHSTRHRLEGAILASCVFGFLMVGLLIWLMTKGTLHWKVGLAGLIGLMGFLASSTAVFVLMTSHAKQISLSHWSLKVVHWVSLGCATLSTGSVAVLAFVLDNWNPTGYRLDTYSKERPLVGKERPLVGKERPLVGKERPLVGKERPLVGKERPLMGKERPLVGKA